MDANIQAREQSYLDAERQDGINELRRDPAYYGQAVIVVGEELSLCHACHAMFAAWDMRSENGEYLEACEARTKSNGPFPKHLPSFAKNDPHAFCSSQCEQDAVDANALDAIELQRTAQDGIFETPELQITLGSYAS